MSSAQTKTHQAVESSKRLFETALVRVLHAGWVLPEVNTRLDFTCTELTARAVAAQMAQNLTVDSVWQCLQLAMETEQELLQAASPK